MKRITFVILALILLSYIAYKVLWEYETFKVSDVTKNESFVYRKWLNGKYTSIRLRIKGEIQGGQAIVKVYDCNDTVTYNLAHTELINGKIDIDTGNDFYTKQACIEYKQRGVHRGHLTVSVSIR
jgi:hypothetical protein